MCEGTALGEVVAAGIATVESRSGSSRVLSSLRCSSTVQEGSTSDVEAFKKKTAIAYSPNPRKKGRILVVCNSSLCYKKTL